MQEFGLNSFKKSLTVSLIGGCSSPGPGILRARPKDEELHSHPTDVWELSVAHKQIIWEFTQLVQ